MRRISNRVSVSNVYLLKAIAGAAAIFTVLFGFAELANAQVLLNPNATALSLGNVDISTASMKSVTLTSVGNAAVVISNVTVSGAGFSATGIPAGLILSPGHAVTLNVAFHPAATGSVMGNIAVSSNAANSPAIIKISAAGVTQLAHFVVLSWMPSTAAISGYNVYSSSVPGGPYTRLGTSQVTGTTYRDSTVLPGNTYYYVLTAVDSNNQESAFSNEVSAAVPLSGGGVAQVPHSVHLSWTPSTSPVAGYNAYSSVVPGGPYSKLDASPVAGTTFTDNTVAAGKTYYYVLTAVDSKHVESAFSSEVSVTVP